MRPSSSSGSLSSAASLSLGKPRSLVVPRGSERAWSTPALSAAFSLRTYAVQTKHIPGERAPRSFGGDPLELPVEEIDLIGGNGKWRMLKAQEEDKKKQEAIREQKRQDRKKADEKKRRQEELAERKRRNQEEEERRWQEEREQKRRDAIEAVRLEEEKKEEDRILREIKEEERRKRMPKTCETCVGSCKCQECMGKGYIFSVFLSSKVGGGDTPAFGRTDMDHGRIYQGCDKCGGYSHNMLGELKKGSGDCPVCNGLGKIWPPQGDKEWQPGDPPVSPKSKSSITGYNLERIGEVKIA